MNTIDVNQVLAQIRSLSSQAANRPATLGPVDLAGAAPAAKPASFTDALKGALDGVNQSQSTAADLQKRFELGDSGTDLASVMLASSKAQVSFRAAVEVRNRLVSAYQDVMNMPL